MLEAHESLRFYTDKHIVMAAVRQLRRRGIDVLRCEDIGLDDAPDEEHLEYSTREGRVIITNDTDFLRLHDIWQAEGRRHAGIMFCLDEVQGEYAIGRIVSEAETYHGLIEIGAGTIEADIANQIIYVG